MEKELNFLNNLLESTETKLDSIIIEDENLEWSKKMNKDILEENKELLDNIINYITLKELNTNE